jgi:hypothetical protein
LVENLSKIMALSRSKLLEGIGDFMIRIVDLIDAVFIMTGSLLQVGLSNRTLNRVIAKQSAKFEVCNMMDGRHGVVCHVMDSG